jgi:nucleoside-diphosphate-sugar epimerase
MKVLVLGGNRFFGKRLVDNFLKAGETVTVLNRGHREDLFGATVETLRCDRRDSAALSALVQGRKWDVVYDQICFEAAEAREACRIFAGVADRYIVTSSQSVYGGGRSIPESTFDPATHTYEKEVTTKEDYAEGKRQVEAIFAREAKFPWVAVRFSVVLGADDYTERLLYHVRKCLREEPVYFPNLQAEFCFADSQNAADALQAMGKMSFTGPINVCSPEPIHIADLLQIIESATGHGMNIVHSERLGEWSPMGIQQDWFMSVQKAQSLGVPLKSLGDWLPTLVRNLVSVARAEDRPPVG